mgnify:FL=1
MNVVDLLRQSRVRIPWKKYYTKEELKFKVEDISIYEMFKRSALSNLNCPAVNYYGRVYSYKEFLKRIDRAALSFSRIGVKKGDFVTICMPNTPEGLISFYAVSKIGAISNMIHPLSGEEEIKNYLNSTKSKYLVMVDFCYEKVRNVISETDVCKVIVAPVSNSMFPHMQAGYKFKTWRMKKPRRSKLYTYWNDFIISSYFETEKPISCKAEDPAVILHSGGTTGKPKGIVLSNGNFNALALQARVIFKDLKPRDKVLGIMPIFHGFGLGVSFHIPFGLGCEVILVPQFNAKKFDELLEKYRPNVICGVPTLYEALTNTKNKKLDLSMLKYVISGGDSLSSNLSERINDFLLSHGSKVKVSQGYGMTEALAAVALSFGDAYRDGSIGIPFPGNYIKIVKPGTQDEVPYGEDGEICVSGPTVMLGYLDNEEETNEMLQKHSDGMIWLHTGDIGMMNENGIIYYKQRLKRMIISSGYNVYPSYIEKVIEEHPAVLNCSVIGVPHHYKVEVPKAYIVLKDGYSPISVKSSIKEHCKKNLAVYSIPHEFVYRKSLPHTLMGKIDFKKLQEDDDEKE